jgi:hypothetical protein
MPADTTIPDTQNEYVGAALYTSVEKKWLEDHWGGEFHFLLAYQLKVYDEEDREEGQAIVRAFSKADEEDGSGSAR